MEPDLTVSEQHLQTVLENAEDDLAHREQLEWDWLEDRVGLAS